MPRIRSNIVQAGGKSLLRDHYARVAPAHDKYLDVFAGGAVLLLWDVHPGGAIYNDLNHLAYNYWRCCRDRGKYEELYRLLRSTEYGREVFKESLVVLEDRGSTDVQRAWAWCVHIVQGFTHQESEVSWRMAKPLTMAQTWSRSVDRLPHINRELQNVNMENLDWRDCLKRYGNGGPRQLTVLDPPYISNTDMTLTYKNPFTLDDHVELLWAADHLDSMVLICGYDSELYNANLLPPKWEKVVKVRQMMVKNSDYESDGEERVECMWLSVGDWRQHTGGLWAVEAE